MDSFKIANKDAFIELIDVSEDLYISHLYYIQLWFPTIIYKQQSI